MSELLERVADEIYRVVLPLPFALRSVNCYLLRDVGGWSLIDTGLHYPAAAAVLQAAFRELGITAQVLVRVVLTHAHPDHYGMAGELAHVGAPPAMLSAAEAAFAQTQWHPDSTNHDTIAAFFAQHGMPAALQERVRDDIIALRHLTQPPPPMLLIAQGDILRIGAREFVAIDTPGHSDGHLAFYAAADRLLVCGDAVLPRITPNVGLWTNTGGDPLAAFGRSLTTLGALDVDLALPGHGAPIVHFAERVAELQRHHEERLAVMQAAVGDGATGYDVCCAVFPTHEFSSHQTRFAMAETLAHLEHLVLRGRLRRTEVDGVTRFLPVC